MSPDFETVVVGAGVVGLAIAHALTRQGRPVLVIERHDRIGAETSSRNSEVVHAGLYYPPGSLKARLCVAGRDRLYRFAAENGVAAPRIGKLLVATSAAEIPRLAAIADNAARNGVGDLVPLDAAAARRLEPELDCVAAVLSPSTGIVDSHDLMAALEGHVTSRGGEIVLRTAVTAIRLAPGSAFSLDCMSGDSRHRLTCRRVVIAAGLDATHLARTIDGYAPGYLPPETGYAKGHYFALDGRAPFRQLIYPMPVAGGLGIHLTLDTGGAAKFGPDVEWVKRPDYTFQDAGGERRAAFEREIRRYWPGLPDGALRRGYTGVRPKLVTAGETAADFAIHGAREHGIEGLVTLYGIESPGLTASLAIGEVVAGQLG